MVQRKRTFARDLPDSAEFVAATELFVRQQTCRNFGTYGNASDADDVQQLSHEKGGQEVHQRRSRQIAKIREQTETDVTEGLLDGRKG